jgi:hypothetical protein
LPIFFKSTNVEPFLPPQKKTKAIFWQRLGLRTSDDNNEKAILTRWRKQSRYGKAFMNPFSL